LSLITKKWEIIKDRIDALTLEVWDHEKRLKRLEDKK